MARSDLVVSLARAGVSGDKKTLVKTVEAIISEERAKQHNIFADRMEKVLNGANGNGQHSAPLEAPERRMKAHDYIAEILPRRQLAELVLPDVTRIATEQLIEEQQRASVLRSHALEPRHKILLVGPPGNGKTSLGEAIAESLAVPLFVVRYESMIGSFLGETAGRLKRVFDYARTTPCVLFFDEFDAVGKERGDTHETGEIKRVVTSLLMQIDELPSYVVVVAATNHAELLDRAVWRRFELRLSLPAPTEKQLAAFIERLGERASMELGIAPAKAARVLGPVSYGEAEQFFLELARRQVLTMGEQAPTAIAKQQLRIWSERVHASARAEESEARAGAPAS